MNVVTSNQISKNCIVGTILLDIWAVINDDEKSLGKFPNVKFYVANSDIILDYPILGTSFLQHNKVILDYQNPDICTISASILNNENQPAIKKTASF